MISSILLVRLRQIGDVVFTTPAIRALREHFPGVRLTYLVEPSAAPVVAKNPHLDEVIVAPRPRGLSGLRAEFALVRRLRAQHFDVVIDFHGGPRASLLTWLSGSPARIGYQIVGRWWMYTKRIARPRGLRPRHSVQNQWDLLAPLGIGAPTPHSFPVEMPGDSEMVAKVATRLSDAGVAAGDQLIVMHVSAGNPFRRWPSESFAAVAASLVRLDDRHRIIVTSGPSEVDAAAGVIEQARSALPSSDRDRVLACGEFSLAELRALVDRASLFIGGDSGPMHVASTSHIPIVTLYGPTLPARSAPWRAADWPSESVEVDGLTCRPCDQRTCAPGDFRCLMRMQPSQVIDAAARALARASGKM